MRASSVTKCGGAQVVLIRPSSLPAQEVHLGRESRPPAGLLYIAAPVVQKGIDIAIVEQSGNPGWKGELADVIGERTICVGITCLTGQSILNGLAMARFARERSACPIVWGGVHPSLEPESTIRSPLVDIVVAGAGEETFPELLESLGGGRPLDVVNGIVFKNNGQPRHTSPRERYDLEQLPPLPFHLARWEFYEGNPGLYGFFHFTGSRAVSIETSRGCTHRCTYCVMSNEFYKPRAQWRGMSAKKMVDVVEAVYRDHGVHSFAFVDDNFFVDIQRVRAFLDELERRALRIEWFADIRMDTVLHKTDENFLRRLEALGLRSLGIGIESGSDQMLRFIRKGETRETYIRANRMLAATNVLPQYGFLQGLPGETPEDIEQTYTLVAEMVEDNPHAAITLNKLLPTPNTPLFEECVKHGLKKPERFEDWATYCDTMWRRGPAVWMDPRTVAMIMRTLYYGLILTIATPRSSKGTAERLLLRLATRVVFFRIRRRFYALPVEHWVLRVLMTPWMIRRLKVLFAIIGRHRAVIARRANASP